jgi:hypothetical protein
MAIYMRKVALLPAEPVSSFLKVTQPFSEKGNSIPSFKTRFSSKACFTGFGGGLFYRRIVLFLDK